MLHIYLGFAILNVRKRLLFFFSPGSLCKNRRDASLSSGVLRARRLFVKQKKIPLLDLTSLRRVVGEEGMVLLRS